MRTRRVSAWQQGGGARQGSGGRRCVRWNRNGICGEDLGANQEAGNRRQRDQQLEDRKPRKSRRTRKGRAGSPSPPRSKSKSPALWAQTPYLLKSQFATSSHGPLRSQIATLNEPLDSAAGARASLRRGRRRVPHGLGRFPRHRHSDRRPGRIQFEPGRTRGCAPVQLGCRTLCGRRLPHGK